MSKRKDVNYRLIREVIHQRKLAWTAVTSKHGDVRSVVMVDMVSGSYEWKTYYPKDEEIHNVLLSVSGVMSCTCDTYKSFNARAANVPLYYYAHQWIFCRHIWMVRYICTKYHDLFHPSAINSGYYPVWKEYFTFKCRFTPKGETAAFNNWLKDMRYMLKHKQGVPTFVVPDTPTATAIPAEETTPLLPETLPAPTDPQDPFTFVF